MTKIAFKVFQGEARVKQHKKTPINRNFDSFCKPLDPLGTAKQAF